ncbi:MAG: hypothetical protein JSV34_00240 [Candidatus Omnitrophota bacterium]|nr:MAG: hypothetical protein JSV34_00240 [Candidatus Omnitrophota bacterium]
MRGSFQIQKRRVPPKVYLLTAVFCLMLGGVSAASPKTHRELRSQHFIINYHESISYDYVDKVKDISEEFYRVITQEFRLVRNKLWLWENRTKIFIARDKEDYLNRFNCPSWSTACVNYKDKIIRTYPDQENFSSILVHELTHIIFREYVGLKKLPLWLDEAVTVYMEDKYSKKSKRRDLSPLKKAIKDNSYIKLAELNTITASNLEGKSQSYVNLFYLEAFSIVSFIIKKYGGDSFSQFMYFLRRGYDYEQALSKAIYSIRGWEDLEKQWKRFYQE